MRTLWRGERHKITCSWANIEKYENGIGGASCWHWVTRIFTENVFLMISKFRGFQSSSNMNESAFSWNLYQKSSKRLSHIGKTWIENTKHKRVDERELVCSAPLGTSWQEWRPISWIRSRISQWEKVLSSLFFGRCAILNWIESSANRSTQKKRTFYPKMHFETFANSK